MWLVGASSGIGEATAAELHARGARVIVSARNAQALQEFKLKHAGAVAIPLDVTDAQSVREASRQVFALGRLDGMVYCAGHYSAMDADAIDLPDMLRHVDINYAGALRLLDAVLPELLARQGKPDGGRGFISLVGSVAGYNGLPRSLAYGPTKAALINLAQTLYLDLHDKGVAVSIINPGFVETPLTSQNRFHMPALLSPQQAAQEILRGWARGSFEIHFPKRFTLWLKLLAFLPWRLSFLLIRQVVR